MRVIVIVLLLIFQSLLSQTTPYFYALNKASDLPSDIVYDIFQDDKSFIWLGTGKGLARFDGLQTKLYTSTKFPTTAVSNILQDKYGRIWSQNFTGDLYYIQSGKIERLSQYKANGFLRYGLTDNHLFIASKDHVTILDLKTLKKIKEIRIDLSDITHSIILNDRYYLVGGQIITVNSSGETKILENDLRSKISGPIPIVGNQKLFIFSKFSSVYYTIEDDSMTKHELPFSTSFTQNANIIDNDIWICTTMGIYQYNTKTKKYKHFFPKLNISFILKTKQNKFWVSTINSGALFIEDFDSNFITTPTKPVKIKRLGQEIYFSTDEDEIMKMLGNDNFKTIYKGTSDHIISPFAIDSLNNSLLMASSKFTIRTPTKEYSSILAVKSITQLDKKYYLIAASSWNGIIYTQPELKSNFDGVFKNLPSSKNNGIHSITLVSGENGKDAIFDQRDNSFYFITNLGIKKYKDGKTTSIQTINKDISFVKFAYINGTIYLLANDEKLYILDNNQPKLVKLPSLISNEGIQNIKVLDQRLFVFKNQFLYCYNPVKNKIIKTLNIPNTLEVHDITSMNGYLYLSCTQGLIKLPLKPTESSQPLLLYINNITVNGKTINEEKLLNLKSNENNIEINFDLVSESPNNKYQIEFRLNNRDWETMENNNRILRFSSLTDGDYNIQFRISNGSQVIHKNVHLTIAPPYYKTWWFMSLTILSFLSITYLIVKWQLERANREHEAKLAQANLEKMANQSKLKSIKSQMNPHFFYNALNTLQSYILANEKREAVNYLSKFSKLTRSILDMSEKDYISIPEEVNTLTNYLELEKVRFNNDFNFTITVDDTLDSHDIQIPTLLLQPFIENALKHGLLHKKGNKYLNIHFYDIDNEIQIIIDDNGIGRQKSQELNTVRQPKHNSFATQALHQKIDLLNHNADKKIKLHYHDKPKGEGTTVTLILPKNTNIL